MIVHTIVENQKFLGDLNAHLRLQDKHVELSEKKNIEQYND